MKKEDYVSFIKELSKIIDKDGLTSIEFKQNDVEIKIKKKLGKVALPQDVSSIKVPISRSIEEEKISNNSREEDYSNNRGAIKSPMVGVIYRAPAPDKENFIQEGSKVKKGDTLFLVEAMKVYNPIKSSVDGIVKKILIQNQQVVEFDEVLAIIE